MEEKEIQKRIIMMILKNGERWRGVKKGGGEAM